MFGKIKCSLGWHDWEDTGTTEITGMAGDVPEEAYYFKPGESYIISDVLYTVEHSKCKRCGKLNEYIH